MSEHFHTLRTLDYAVTNGKLTVSIEVHEHNNKLFRNTFRVVIEIRLAHVSLRIIDSKQCTSLQRTIIHMLL